MRKKFSIILAIITICCVLATIFFGYRGKFISTLSTRVNNSKAVTVNFPATSTGAPAATFSYTTMNPIIQTQDKDFTLTDKDIIGKATQLLGKSYPMNDENCNVAVSGGKDVANYTKGASANSASNVNYVDCADLIWWTLKSIDSNMVIRLGNTSSYSEIPYDVARWVTYGSGSRWFSEVGNFARNKTSPYTPYFDQFDGSADTIENYLKGYSGNDMTKKMNVLKRNDPITNELRWYKYYDANGNLQDIPAGTFIIAMGDRGAIDGNGSAHSWIALGNLGTSNVDDVVTILNSKYGLSLNKNNVVNKGTSTYWRIESSANDKKVTINNGNPDMGQNAGGKKIINAIWAFQVARQEEEKPGTFNFEIEKVDADTEKTLSGVEFKYAEGEGADKDFLAKYGIKLIESAFSEGHYLSADKTIKNGETKYYCILETNVPEPYVKFDKVIKLKVSNVNNKIEYSLEGDSSNDLSLVGMSNGTITIKLKNRKPEFNSYDINLKKVDEQGNEISSAKFDTTYDYTNAPSKFYSDQEDKDALFKENTTTEYVLNSGHRKENNNVTNSGSNITDGEKEKPTIGAADSAFCSQALAVKNTGAKLYADANKKTCDNIAYNSKDDLEITDKYTFKEQKINGYIQDENTYMIKVTKSYNVSLMVTNGDKTYFGRISKVELYKKDGNKETLLTSTNITYKIEGNTTTAITAEWGDNHETTSGNVTVKLEFPTGSNVSIKVKEKNKKNASYSLNIMKKDSNSTKAGDEVSDALGGASFNVELYKNIAYNTTGFNFGSNYNTQPDPMQNFGDVDSVAGKYSGPFTRENLDKNCLEYTLDNGSKVVSYDIWKIKEKKQPSGYSAMKHQLVLGVEKQYDDQNKTYNIKGIRVFQVAGNNQDGNQINWTSQEVTYTDTKGNTQKSDICTEYATYLYKDADGCQWNIVLNKAHNNIIVTARNDKRYGSFNFNLTKTIKDTQSPLEGAGFKVSIINTKTNTALTTKSGKKIDGTTEYKTNSEGKIDEIKDINLESTDKLKVTITESTVPDGYYGLVGPITFEVTPELSTDGKSYTLKGDTPEVANAKKVEVKTGEVLVEAENRAVTIHKGVKEVENQDSGYYNEITGDTYESAEDAKKVLHDWVINVPLDKGILASKVYQVEDTIDERLTYEGVASVKLKDKLDLAEDIDYKVNYNEETRLLTITFKDENMDFSDNIKNNTDETIEIRFNTKFATDEDGKIIGINQSIPNQATLVYGNNNRLNSETPEIHTGGVGIYKYDNVTKKALEGAHFKIATSEENARNKKFLKDTEGNDVEVVTDENGKAEFTGLEFGEDAMDNAKYKTIDETTGAEVYKYDWSKVETIYYIVETEAPVGYKLIEQPRKVVVKKDNYVMEDITSLLQVDNEQKVFDLALRKWVTQAIVTENGKTVVTETGHHAEDDPEEVVKVDLKKSKLNKVTVKFRYSIRVTNEGEVAGEAKEIRDDIPKGLKFVAEDNPDWREEYGQIVTDKLAGTTLQPGESAEVEIVLTWVNSEENIGVMVNTAEIEKDHNDFGIPDRDSTPGNNVPGEDDIDDAPVMITIKTGTTGIAIYTSIALGALLIISVGGVVIKKKVVEQIQ